MPQVLELIRNSQLPSNLMQSAARGSLSVPPGEMIEILVYLALHHKLFGDQARMTLAGWDEKASLAAAADPGTSNEVLGYFVSLDNLRPFLLPSLAENPSVGEELLDGLAVSGTRSVVEVLLKSARVMSSSRLLQALQANACLRPNELAEIAKQLAALEVNSGAEPPAPESDENHEALEVTLTKYLEVNAAELEAEKDKPFQPIGIAHELVSVEAAGEVGPQAAAATGSASADAAEIGDGRNRKVGHGRSRSYSCQEANALRS